MKPARLPPPPRPEASPVELDYRHRTWSERRTRIRAAMEAAGYGSSRRERFDNCGACCRVQQHHHTGELRTRAFYCHDRFCDPCGQAKSLLVADNLVEQLAGSTMPGVHVVLTRKHRRAPLADQITDIVAAFNKLRARPWWKSRVDGGAYFIQAHVSPTDGLWHVHIHAIGLSFFLDALELSLAWRDVTGDSSNVHVSRIADAAAVAKEVARYVAKSVDHATTLDPDKLAELMRALTGRRLCSTFGTWRGFKLTKKPEIDQEAESLWVDVGPLVEICRKAAQGDDYANWILDRLWKRSHPKTGPPVLGLLFDAAAAAPSRP